MIKNYKKKLKKYIKKTLLGKKIETTITITNFNKKSYYEDKNDILLSFYDSNGKIFEKNFKILRTESLNLNVNNLISSNNIDIKKSEQIIWFTLESKTANYFCSHIHRSSQGLITADHAF